MRKGTRRANYDRNALIADWMSGQYSQPMLAKRYGIAKSTVQQLLAGIPRERTGGQHAGRRERQEMTREERTRYVRFFNSAGMLVARAALRRVKSKQDLSMMEMRQASDIVNGQRAGILGKQPDTAIQINTGAGAEGAATLEEYRQAREKIVGEF